MNRFWSFLFATAMVAFFGAATAKAEVDVFSGDDRCVFNAKPNDVIRVACFFGDKLEFIKEYKLVEGADGITGSFDSISWRVFITHEEQDEAIVAFKGGVERLFL